MLSSLVDLLIEKGVITEEEYEKRIKQKVKVKELKLIVFCIPKFESISQWLDCQLS